MSNQADCPNCGYEHEFDREDDDGDYIDLECQRCGQLFAVDMTLADINDDGDLI